MSDGRPVDRTTPVRHYPESLTPAGMIAPAPRRIRGVLAGGTVFDTTLARYGWEWPGYPQYYVPLADVARGVLVDEGVEAQRALGPARRHALRLPGATRPEAAWLHTEGELRDTVRFAWSALDAWFEEDEEVFVHPRNPYVRVDALRSTRSLRVELTGIVLARSSSPVMVFETGLPTRYYVPRTAVDWSHLEPSGTVTDCPYKGRTSGYWSVRAAGGGLHRDLAWAYDFPTAALLPVAGLVAFYNEKVDLFLDGEPLDRPVPHSS